MNLRDYARAKADADIAEARRTYPDFDAKRTEILDWLRAHEWATLPDACKAIFEQTPTPEMLERWYSL